MNTLERIEKELAEAKIKLKLAKAAQVVFDAFNNRERYSFENIVGDKHVLFGRDKIMMFAELQIKASDVKHFDEMYEINYDVKPSFTRELRLALQLIEKNYEFFRVVIEIFRENYK